MADDNSLIETAIHASIIDKIENPVPQRKHIDFIVGRGRLAPQGYLNIPLSDYMKTRNIVFVDPALEHDADIQKLIENVNFSNYRITHLEDPNEMIDVNIIFDWSTFYCTALQSMKAIADKIGRRFKVYVPLAPDEKKIPSIIKEHLSNPKFIVTIVEAQYPMFKIDQEEYKNIMNMEQYMLILVNH
ncbi:MAG: hypothetical protein Dasosvirus8_6 [Dasosvirus sp.]|uniref:Uncharacterized protein n=1 Tax=Dasosvirus sp. TaxID=2487764 RepID=A0A3G4ZRM9_9VIRU|nr:MAG: hypothetical protein Dasosvirus8_6 [Dasosvirus sp.]